MDALAEVGVACWIGTADDLLDWPASLRAFHRPVEVGPLRLRPPWEPTTPDLLDLVIDPGMAFGTGQHATTHGCLELLVDRPPGPVLDIGCGSGVLAIAAARLGHAPVRAIDNDPDAVAATADNAAANGLSIDVRTAVAGAEPLPAADIEAREPHPHRPDRGGADPARAQGGDPRAVCATTMVAVLADALAASGLDVGRAVARDGWSTVSVRGGFVRHTFRYLLDAPPRPGRAWCSDAWTPTT